MLVGSGKEVVAPSGDTAASQGCPLLNKVHCKGKEDREMFKGEEYLVQVYSVLVY